MSEWKKVENPVDGASEPAPEKTAEPAPAPKKEAPSPAEPPSSTLGLEPEDIPTGDDADKTPAPRVSEPKPPPPSGTPPPAGGRAISGTPPPWAFW